VHIAIRPYGEESLHSKKKRRPPDVSTDMIRMVPPALNISNYFYYFISSIFFVSVNEPA
jgi:hypothetical protein